MSEPIDDLERPFERRRYQSTIIAHGKPADTCCPKMAVALLKAAWDER